MIKVMEFICRFQVRVMKSHIARKYEDEINLKNMFYVDNLEYHI